MAGMDETSDPFYSEANQARLSKAVADLNAGKGKAHELAEKPKAKKRLLPPHINTSNWKFNREEANR